MANDLINNSEIITSIIDKPYFVWIFSTDSIRGSGLTPTLFRTKFHIFDPKGRFNNNKYRQEHLRQISMLLINRFELFAPLLRHVLKTSFTLFSQPLDQN